jgi:predicted nucleic acid-binding protein
LLKLLLPEPESPAVQTAVSVEDRVVLSPLVELEAEVQLRAGWLGGRFTRNRYRGLTERLRLLGQRDPFKVQPLPGTIFETALRQHRDRRAPHVRTLDRLHLAAMEELGLRRLMTHDTQQAEAARAVGFEVVAP